MKLLKQMRFLIIIICYFAWSQAVYADIDQVPTATSAKESGTIDDSLAGWLWFGMSSIPDQASVGGTVHAGGPSSHCTYVFRGSSVEVFASTGQWISVDGHNHKFGSMKIEIDGKQVGVADLRRPVSESSVSVARFDGLSDSNHAIELSGEEGWIDVDYITVGGSTGQPVDFSQGFGSGADIHLNGSAAIKFDSLVLTDGPLKYQSASAFSSQPVTVRKFKSRFQLQLLNAIGDGIAFVIQSSSPSALGAPGEGLGYRGIDRSIAIKFDIFDNAGEGNDSTGLYLNGYSPTVPAIDLSHSNIILSSGDPIDVSIDYDGTVLRVWETDIKTGSTASQKYPIDIPSVVGDNAYVGFTGSDGDKTATQVVLSWSYSGKAP